MSDPSAPKSDDASGIDPPEAGAEQASRETLPLDGPTDRKSADSVPENDPLLAATQVELSVDLDSHSPTMALPTGTDQTLDFPSRAARRKASAVLHTHVGDYEIEQELGRGGMGVVYKARHRQLRRDVALKMILAGRHAGPEQLERFLTEARAVAQLQHPNIVQIFDIGEHEQLPYFSLEYVDGKSLAHHLDKKPQVPEEAGQTLELLARAMQYAHDHGVLHRDLKPANILLTKEGVPKITDFGLAKKIDDDESASTRTGTVMGTPSYMSPEQALGMTHEVGPAADQYSLGAILYEMLTGRPPFLAAKAVDTILQVIHKEPIPPRQLQPSIPVDLETICLKALQKEPAKRYASCLELAEDARRFREGVPILARPVGTTERAWRWCRRNPHIAIPSISAVVLLFLIAVVSTWASITVARQNVIIKAERDNAQAQEALAKAAQAVAEQEEKKAAEQARIAAHQRGLALETLYNLATKVDQKLIDRPETRELRQELITDVMNGLRKVEESDDTRSVVDRTMGVAHQRLASVFQNIGDTEAATQQHEQAVAIFEKLIALNPRDDWAKYDAAISYDFLGNAARDAKGDPAKMRDYYLKAIRLREQLQAGLHIEDRALTPLHVELSLINSYAKFGTLAMAAREIDSARDYFTKALNTSQRLLDKNPQLGLARQAMAGSYMLFGNFHFRTRASNEALQYYDRALQIQQSLIDDSPHSVREKLGMSRFLQQRGNVKLQLLRDFHAAQSDYEKALEICESLHASDPKDATVRRELGTTLHCLGTACWLLDQPDIAREHFREAVAHRKTLADDAPTVLSGQMELMHSQARAGDHAEAFQLGQSLLPRLTEDLRGLYNLVCGFSICATSAAHQEEGNGAEPDTPAVAQYRDAALKTLKQAISLGYKDLFALETDPDLASLRDDPRFEELVQAVQSQ